MKLMIGERLVLLQTLPSEGNFLTLKMLRELRERLVPTEEEQARLAIRDRIDPEGKQIGIEWNRLEEAKTPFAEIEISVKAHDLIKGALKKLDKEQKLTEQHFSLYEKFCATEEKE